MTDSLRIGAAGVGLVLALFAGEGSARAQGSSASDDTAAQAPGATPSGNSQENLTVLGRHHKFEAAPMPGPEMGPPPDKPAPHLGRYKISGDQTQKDGYDAQTGSYIAPFGSAYTDSSPVANGLASRYGH